MSVCTTCHLNDVARSVNSQVVFWIRHGTCAMDMSIHTHMVMFARHVSSSLLKITVSSLRIHCNL